MYKNLKRLYSISLVVFMMFCLNTVSFASNTDFVSVSKENTDLDSLAAARAYPAYAIATETNMGRGTVTVTVHLNQSYSGIAFRVAATSNPSATYNCSVRYPNGTVCSLDLFDGALPADGTYKSYVYDHGTVPAGDYVFTFKMSNDNLTACVATIYKAGY